MKNLEVQDYLEKVRKSLPTIGLDMLKSFGPGILNRDRSGNQKTTFYGGVLRARFSEWSFSRVMQDMENDVQSYATRYIPRLIISDLKNKHPEATEEYLDEVREVICGLFETKEDSEKEIIVKNTIVFSIYDSEDFINVITDRFPVNAKIDEIDWLVKKQKESKEKSKKKNEPTLQECMSLEIKKILTENANGRQLDMRTAMYGKMVTDTVIKTIDSALTRSGGMAVNALEGGTEHFSRVDELKRSLGESQGSAHMDEYDLNAACYYIHHGIHTRILFDNLCIGRKIESKEDIDAILFRMTNYILTYIQRFITATPMSKKGAHYSNTKPVVLYITIGQCLDMTLETAFAKPITAKNGQSIERNAAKAMKERIEIDSLCEYDTFGWRQEEYDKTIWVAGSPEIECPKGCTALGFKKALEEIKEYMYGISQD